MSNRERDSVANKRCSRCAESKPLAEYHAARTKRGGLRSRCKTCVKEYTAAYYRDNSAEENDRSSAWRRANPELVKASRAAYRRSNRAKCNESTAAWRKANPEAAAAYRRDNRERDRERRAAWHKAHPEAMASQQDRRRALKLGSVSTATVAERKAIMADAYGLCSYCGKAAKLTLDHVEPLSRGGDDSADNLMASCGPCNSGKNTRPLIVWLALLGRDRAQVA